MKRHSDLQDLSREHYAALKLALAAKRAALAGDPAAVAGAAALCRQAYASELEAHFAVEESQLLPRLAAAGQDELVHRTADEHRQLRQLARQLEAADAAILLRFSECLSAHVRFEERELFEALQRYCF